MRKRTGIKPGPKASGSKPPNLARYIMIGGFLGAGKTTAVAQLARRLRDQGLRVGLITNDQGQNLVDTALLRSHGFVTEEIPGGCFCCRFNSLVEAAARLTAKAAPDAFIAEPVGSCTDLVATVTYPLRRLYGKNFRIAPLSVLVDPIRARRIFGLEAGGNFSGKVLYIYQKQLEEADLIVINKCDLLNPPMLAELQAAMERRYPRSEVIAVSARDGTNLGKWFERLTSLESARGTAMDVDYDTYAEGEALLGWLNATIQLTARKAFDPDAFVERLATGIQKRLLAAEMEIAHLKLTLSPDEGFPGLAAANLVRNDFVPELSMKLEQRLKSGQLILNLRAEADPARLAAAVRESIVEIARAFPTLQTTEEHLEQFRPGRPQPTHRDQVYTAP